MYKRCLSLGYDMAEDLIQVTPTAHFQMGGVKIDSRCESSLGASTLRARIRAAFTARTGSAATALPSRWCLAGWPVKVWPNMPRTMSAARSTRNQLAEIVARYGEPRAGAGDVFALRRRLGQTAWENLGVIRSQESLSRAAFDLDEIGAALAALPVPENRAGDIAFLERLDTQNLVTVATMMRVAATLRQESRGSHYRSDCAETDPDGFYNIFLQRKGDGEMIWEKLPVQFTRRQPEALLGDTAIPTAPPRMEARTEA